MSAAVARELPRPSQSGTKPAGGHPARARPVRPDPRPMRLVYGAGSLVALSALTVGLVHPSDMWTAAEPTEALSAWTAAPSAVLEAIIPSPTIEIIHRTRYIQLQPGQTAPPGATVIRGDAPTPKVIVKRSGGGGSGGGGGSSGGGSGGGGGGSSGGGSGGGGGGSSGGGGGGGATAAPKPTPKPTPAPTPTPKTRQSG